MMMATSRSAPLEDAENGLQLGAQLLDRLGGEGASRFGLELPRAAVLLDLLPRAFDRVFLRVQQVFDEHDQLDLTPLVHTVARAVLGGVEKAELALPVAQHVGLEIGQLADFADREKLLDRLGRRSAAHRLSAFNSRSMRSLIAWRGGLFWNNTLATSRAMGSSIPCRSPSATAVRAVFTPSTTAALPASPANVIGCAPRATPRRVISASPRVINAARVLNPRPRPSRIPAANAITFLSAPASSTPTTSVCE